MPTELGRLAQATDRSAMNVEELPTKDQRKKVTDWTEFEDESNIIPPSESSSNQQEWDANESESKFYKSLHKNEILVVFDRNEKLHEILSRNGTKRCIKKVKGMFKGVSKPKQR